MGNGFSPVHCPCSFVHFWSALKKAQTADILQDETHRCGGTRENRINRAAVDGLRKTGLGLESSRGCPFDCVFCSTSYRKSWRGIDAREVVDRLEQILPYTARTRLGLVQIIDDEFSIKTRRCIDICNEIKHRDLLHRRVW